MAGDAAALFYAFPRKIDLGLARVEAALAALGRPQDRVPPIVHVAGTNGKGSTIAFMRAMIEAAGRSAHAYTSPHLVTIHERWRVSGKMIDEAALFGLAQTLLDLSRTIPLTVFEAETVAAFMAFSQTPADFTLLEVGLGGRLDATNVIAAPAMSIITPVDFDHKDMLGDTLAQIGAEKAGILKQGVPAILSRQAPDALAAILARAKEVGAAPLVYGRDWDCYAQRGRLVVQSGDRLLDLPAPSLPGAHQYDNAGAAALAMSHLGLDDATIAAGITRAHWPARLQRITSGPLYDLAHSRNATLWLDGGHNPHGARAAAAFMAQLALKDPRPLGLIAGLMARKDAAGFFDAFTALAPLVACVPITSSDDGMSTEDLARAAHAKGLRAQSALSPIAALQHLLSDLGEGARILICGSLYLAGEVLALSANENV
ncbi:MAG: hypothetical protein RLZZ157_1445 [Pseudomonadota bacterium]|jgi:dihydrofolate synthase/folylpolyglutamate synthase